MIGLFNGSPAPHPAAALASWKLASREPERLGKPLEAVLASFNPEMAREWSAFHGARLGLGFRPEIPGLCWNLFVPNDDGTLDALITSLRISGGTDEAPLDSGRFAVERLGGPGAPVAARDAPGVIFASSRAELERALKGPERPGNLDRAGEDITGVAFQLVPGRWVVPTGASVPLRRALELLRGLPRRSVEGVLTIHDDRMAIDLTSRGEAVRSHAIEPEWLDWMPLESSAALACLAIGGDAAHWDALFALADRVDRADPEHANLAPLRARLNLLAAAARVPLEADLWPHLRGLTFGLLADGATAGAIRGGFLALHLDDEASARKLMEQTLPRLASLRGRPETKPATDTESLSLGNLDGVPLSATARGRTLLTAWGDDTLAAILRTREHPERSVRSILAPGRDRVPVRLAAFWPGRLRLPVAGLDGPTPLSESLAEGPPIIWTGWNEGEVARDQVSWPGLSALVRRFLGRIPLANETIR